MERHIWQAYLARQTLVALRNIFSLGAVHGHSHADVNLAYAGLQELELAAQDILLHRSGRHQDPLFQELRLFSSQGTCTFSRAFTVWRRKFEDWQLQSDRTYGICRIPTDTDFTREIIARSSDTSSQAKQHPFYMCSYVVGDAENIWILPGAPSWWHDDMWRLGRDVGGMSVGMRQMPYVRADCNYQSSNL